VLPLKSFLAANPDVTISIGSAVGDSAGAAADRRPEQDNSDFSREAD